MSESSTLSVPAGFPAEALTLLVAKGHLKGSLTPDDVIAVLEQVELTPELIDEVRTRLKAEGIPFDESGDHVTDEDLTDENLTAPPPIPTKPAVAVAPSPRAPPNTRAPTQPAPAREGRGGRPPRPPGPPPTRVPPPGRRRPARIAVPPSAPPIRCACTSRRSARSRCSPVRKRCRSRSA